MELHEILKLEQDGTGAFYVVERDYNKSRDQLRRQRVEVVSTGEPGYFLYHDFAPLASRVHKHSPIPVNAQGATIGERIPGFNFAPVQFYRVLGVPPESDNLNWARVTSSFRT